MVDLLSQKLKCQNGLTKSWAVTFNQRHLWNGLIEASYKQQVGDPELPSSNIDQDFPPRILGSEVLAAPFRVYGPDTLQ